MDCQRVVNLLRRHSIMRTIALISQKGGSGKTTTLLNLAVAAQQAGYWVLVVDLDLQASSTDWHKARADKSLHVQPTHPAGLPDLLKAAEGQPIRWSDRRGRLFARALPAVALRPRRTDRR